MRSFIHSTVIRHWIYLGAKIKDDTMGWVLSCMGGLRSSQKTLARKPQGSKPILRSRHRWENNIKMKTSGNLVWCGFSYSDRVDWRILVYVLIKT
jgi:hypothetical protein